MGIDEKFTKEAAIKLEVKARALLKALDLNIFIPTKNPVRQLQL